MHVFDGPGSLRAALGGHLGHSGWHEITQDRVNAFADATGDHQWIHLDGDEARRGPFGGPVAHGYLTLSLLPMLGREVYGFTGFSMGINYGLNRVRFPAVVPVGSRVRLGAELTEVADVPQGIQAVFHYTIEIDGSAKPACVADAVVLLVP
jgi:acyl dehydratase